MPGSWKKDLNKSSNIFLKIIWPKIIYIIGGGKVIPVETVTEENFKKLLDQKAGIDNWQVIGTCIRGIASRIQYNVNYKTFTIRHTRIGSDVETEYQKRMRAIYGEGGFLYPHYTVQAYIKEPENKILSIGIIHTRSLFDYIQRYQDEIIYRHVSNNGAAIFMVAKWHLIKEKIDMDMHIIDEDIEIEIFKKKDEPKRKQLGLFY